MSKEITAKECALHEVFSPMYEFKIPPYQRPYAWTTEESGQLVEDLYSSYMSNPNNNYFIGSIILIKAKDNEPSSDVVDGQQRLTTLTIILSAIVYLFSDEKYKNAFIEYIKQPENLARRLEEKARLVVRDKDKNLFEKFIINCNFDKLEQEHIDIKQESLKNIKQNTLHILNLLKKYFKTDSDLLEFGQFLINQCFLVIVSTHSQESAARIFSVMNNRGLDLLPTDILKADIIDKISVSDQEYYTFQWEECEHNLTRDGFAELFYYIRMIYAKNKATYSILKEFRDSVIKGNQPASSADAKRLIDNVIVPYAKALDAIECQNYQSENDGLSEVDKNINDCFSWLNRIEVSEWKPVAIAFYVKHTNDTAYLAWFYQKLERLAAVLFITASNANDRISRFAQVLEEIEKGKDTINSPLKTIELTKNEKKAMLAILKGDIYTDLIPSRRKYLMLRLDSFVSTGNAKYDVPIVSIEHVLPQSMNDDWKKDWKTTAHTKWCNKIANLVLLSRRKNSQASNYDFAKKKSKYFEIGNTSSFALTTQVCGTNKWTEDVVSKRQDDLLKILKNKWRL